MENQRSARASASRLAWRRGLSALSGPPERAWPEGVIHHGARLVLLVGLAIAVGSLFPVAPVPDFPVLEKGMVAEKDILAEVPFPIYKSPEELARERAEAAAAVALVFDYDSMAVREMRDRVRAFLAEVDSAATRPGAEGARAAIRSVLQAYGFSVTDEAVGLLQSAGQRMLLARSLERAMQGELLAGVASTADLAGSRALHVRVRRGGTEQLVARDSVLTAPRFHERAAAYLPRNASPELAELHRLILTRFFQPSLRLNHAETEAARDRARQAVPTTKGEVLKGEKIVGAHEQIREAELERLRAYEAELARLGRLDADAAWSRSLGAFLFNLFVLGIIGLILYTLRRPIYHEFRHVLLIALLILALAGAAAVIARSGAPVELIPIALPVLVVAVLWDRHLALELALLLAVLLAAQTPFLGISALFTLAAGGSVAALTIRAVRRRAQTWVFISIIAAGYAAASLALGLLRSHLPGEILWSMAWGTLNAAGSTLVAMGCLPLFESFTRITTDLTLLELADLNRPLLRRLSLEAPGTFAHSMNAANLGEAAARAIGANALLTRVGLYYHDVGKILKPQYFIENQTPGRNPHDKLKPATSAAIVRDHVRQGLRLAQEAKLPSSVRAFIAEHHGTQQISFFYEQAKRLDPTANLDPADFTYPGPKPQSKETAVAMLADSVESAIRALPDPTPQAIRALVDRVVTKKMEQGQLDETPLTLRELSIIRDQFVSVLSGMYHHRIDYPSLQETRDAEEEAASAVGASSRAPSAGHG
ncbi:MAG TPA: HDIG domain-containing metalloprotein [Longimicrobiales bacterium]